MARIREYELDRDLELNDKVLGTDYMDGSTMNFSMQDLGEFLASRGLADPSALDFQFQHAGNSEPDQILSGELYYNNTAPALLTQVYISNTDLKGLDTGPLSAYLLGSVVEINDTQASRGTDYGFYDVSAVEAIDDGYLLTVSLHAPNDQTPSATDSVPTTEFINLSIIGFSGAIGLTGPQGDSISATVTTDDTVTPNTHTVVINSTDGATGDVTEVDRFVVTDGRDATGANQEIAVSSPITSSGDASGDDGDITIGLDQSAIQITSSQVTDFDTEVANNSAVSANTDKNTYPDADAEKVGFITVTQDVDLDAIELASHPAATASDSGTGNVVTDISIDASTQAITVTKGTVTGGTGGGGAVVIADDGSSTNSVAVPAGGIAVISATQQYYNVSGSPITVGTLANNAAATTYFETTNASSWTQVGDGVGSGGDSIISTGTILPGTFTAGDLFILQTTDTTTSGGPYTPGTYFTDGTDWFEALPEHNYQFTRISGDSNVRFLVDGSPATTDGTTEATIPAAGVNLPGVIKFDSSLTSLPTGSDIVNMGVNAAGNLVDAGDVLNADNIKYSLFTSQVIEYHESTTYLANTDLIPATDPRTFWRAAIFEVLEGDFGGSSSTVTVQAELDSGVADGFFTVSNLSDANVTRINGTFPSSDGRGRVIFHNEDVPGLFVGAMCANQTVDGRTIAEGGVALSGGQIRIQIINQVTDAGITIYPIVDAADENEPVPNFALAAAAPTADTQIEVALVNDIFEVTNIGGLPDFPIDIAEYSFGSGVNDNLPNDSGTWVVGSGYIVTFNQPNAGTIRFDVGETIRFVRGNTFFIAEILSTANAASREYQITLLTLLTDSNTGNILSPTIADDDIFDVFQNTVGPYSASNLDGYLTESDLQTVNVINVNENISLSQAENTPWAVSGTTTIIFEPQTANDLAAGLTADVDKFLALLGNPSSGSTSTEIATASFGGSTNTVTIPIGTTVTITGNTLVLSGEHNFTTTNPGRGDDIQITSSITGSGTFQAGSNIELTVDNEVITIASTEADIETGTTLPATGFHEDLFVLQPNADPATNDPGTYFYRATDPTNAPTVGSWVPVGTLRVIPTQGDTQNFSSPVFRSEDTLGTLLGIDFRIDENNQVYATANANEVFPFIVTTTSTPVTINDTTTGFAGFDARLNQGNEFSFYTTTAQRDNILTVGRVLTLTFASGTDEEFVVPITVISRNPDSGNPGVDGIQIETRFDGGAAVRNRILSFGDASIGGGYAGYSFDDFTIVTAVEHTIAGGEVLLQEGTSTDPDAFAKVSQIPTNVAEQSQLATFVDDDTQNSVRVLDAISFPDETTIRFSDSEDPANTRDFSGGGGGVVVNLDGTANESIVPGGIAIVSSTKQYFNITSASIDLPPFASEAAATTYFVTTNAASWSQLGDGAGAASVRFAAGQDGVVPGPTVAEATPNFSLRGDGTWSAAERAIVEVRLSITRETDDLDNIDRAFAEFLTNADGNTYNHNDLVFVFYADNVPALITDDLYGEFIFEGSDNHTGATNANLWTKVNTDLGVDRTTTTVTITNSQGNDALIPQAVTNGAGVISYANGFTLPSSGNTTNLGVDSDGRLVEESLTQGVQGLFTLDVYTAGVPSGTAGTDYPTAAPTGGVYTSASKSITTVPTSTGFTWSTTIAGAGVDPAANEALYIARVIIDPATDTTATVALASRWLAPFEAGAQGATGADGDGLSAVFSSPNLTITTVPGDGTAGTPVVNNVRIVGEDGATIYRGVDDPLAHDFGTETPVDGDFFIQTDGAESVFLYGPYDSSQTTDALRWDVANAQGLHGAADTLTVTAVTGGVNLASSSGTNATVSDGEVGDSAYQTWVDAGNTFQGGNTIDNFLASLVGADGMNAPSQFTDAAVITNINVTESSESFVSPFTLPLPIASIITFTFTVEAELGFAVNQILRVSPESSGVAIQGTYFDGIVSSYTDTTLVIIFNNMDTQASPDISEGNGVTEFATGTTTFTITPSGASGGAGEDGMDGMDGQTPVVGLQLTETGGDHVLQFNQTVGGSTSPVGVPITVQNGADGSDGDIFSLDIDQSGGSSLDPRNIFNRIDHTNTGALSNQTYRVDINNAYVGNETVIVSYNDQNFFVATVRFARDVTASGYTNLNLQLGDLALADRVGGASGRDLWQLQESDGTTDSTDPNDYSPDVLLPSDDASTGGQWRIALHDPTVAPGTGITNLDIGAQSDTTLQITSSTGTGVTLPLASSSASQAGLISGTIFGRIGAVGTGTNQQFLSGVGVNQTLDGIIDIGDGLSFVNNDLSVTETSVTLTPDADVTITNPLGTTFGTLDGTTETFQFGLSNTGAVAGTYGGLIDSEAFVPRVTVDAKGRITGIQQIHIETGGVQGSISINSFAADSDFVSTAATNVSQTFGFDISYSLDNATFTSGTVTGMNIPSSNFTTVNITPAQAANPNFNLADVVTNLMFQSHRTFILTMNATDSAGIDRTDTMSLELQVTGGTGSITPPANPGITPGTSAGFLYTTGAPATGSNVEMFDTGTVPLTYTLDTATGWTFTSLTTVPSGGSNYSTNVDPNTGGTLTLPADASNPSLTVTARYTNTADSTTHDFTTVYSLNTIRSLRFGGLPFRMADNVTLIDPNQAFWDVEIPNLDEGTNQGNYTVRFGEDAAGNTIQFNTTAGDRLVIIQDASEAQLTEVHVNGDTSPGQLVGLFGSGSATGGIVTTSDGLYRIYYSNPIGASTSTFDLI